VYKATVQPKLLRSLDQIQENIKKWKHGVGELVIDVRPHDRYTGETPDIRPGVQSGHMPFTKNIPYIKLINMKTGEMISV
jgi:thiosulfate/3-mercaptopyruvate sulfurtransferase